MHSRWRSQLFFCKVCGAILWLEHWKEESCWGNPMSAYLIFRSPPNVCGEKRTKTHVHSDCFCKPCRMEQQLNFAAYFVKYLMVEFFSSVKNLILQRLIVSLWRVYFLLLVKFFMDFNILKLNQVFTECLQCGSYYARQWSCKRK